MRKNKNGFTLVELSIVLVIIGLLIGGILAAQSMIGTAKIQAVVRQLGQYDAAIANFKTKYNQLPGDNNIFQAGDNDGIINGSESAYAWQNLSLGTNLKNKFGNNYDTTPSAASLSEVNCPKFDLYQNTITQPCLHIEASWVSNAGTRNYYAYKRGEFYSDTDAIDDVIKPVDASAIDSKIDDNKASNGKVISAGTLCRDAGNNDIYLMAQSSYACVIFIELGTNNGGIGNN